MGLGSLDDLQAVMVLDFVDALHGAASLLLTQRQLQAPARLRGSGGLRLRINKPREVCPSR